MNTVTKPVDNKKPLCGKKEVNRSRGTKGGKFLIGNLLFPLCYGLTIIEYEFYVNILFKNLYTNFFFLCEQALIFIDFPVPLLAIYI